MSEPAVIEWSDIVDTDPDLQLIRRCQAGDNDAFNELVQRHKDRVYGLIYRMLRDVPSVDDVAQDIFVKAYSRIGSFRFRSSFSTWLTRIAVNQCISHLRRRRKLRLFLVEGGIHQPDEPHDLIERDERREKVCNAINSLPPKGKAVIILRYFEGHSCKEIAGILNCSVGTVKSRLFHARKALKKRLEPYISDGNRVDAGSEIGGEGYEMFKM